MQLLSPVRLLRRPGLPGLSLWLWLLWLRRSLSRLGTGSQLGTGRRLGLEMGRLPGLWRENPLGREAGLGLRGLPRLANRLGPGLGSLPGRMNQQSRPGRWSPQSQ
jgi:hypothetical protein